MKNNYHELLPLVRKPSQYLGNEINAIKKDHNRVKVKVALAFPDLYELGMSHLGLRILYHIINQQPDLAAERVFAPLADMEALHKKRGYPLCSLESSLPLKEFDIVGFTLPYELCYTNILNMLELGGIPWESDKRGENDPLVIAGGSCSGNPEPMAECFDLILLGDGEEAILEIIETYRSSKEAGLSRSQSLLELAKIEGVYVPSLFRFEYAQDGPIKEIIPLVSNYSPIRKRIITELRPEYFPTNSIVPFSEIVHDRIAIEVARGCTRFCRFCQAGVIYRPLRERKHEEVLKIARESLTSTGYEELSLLSLNIGSYSFLNQTVPCLMEDMAPNYTALSLPSIRPGTVNPRILQEIERVRKTGFTLAPEAATERLRNTINKRVSDEELLENIKEIIKGGWESLKLYFMIGLPTETEEDLEALVDLSYRALDTARRQNGRLKNIKISVSSFVPKAHTPFQWIGQNEPWELKKKQEFLRKKLRHHKFTLNVHKAELSLLEAVMSRGDRRLFQVIKEARQMGCSFDGWTDSLDFSAWERALEKYDVRASFYAHRNLSKDEILPWSHLDLGINQDFLWHEYEKALTSEPSGDCYEAGCLNCGPCVRKKPATTPTPIRIISPEKPKVNVCQKIRLEYEKRGKARFLSHLELLKVFWRAIRRLGLPLGYSGGFHPHPLITFSSALPVGVESLKEIVDIQFYSYIQTENLLKDLETELPEGLKPLGACEIPLQSPPPSDIFVKATYLIRPGKSTNSCTPPTHEEVKKKIENFLSQSSIPLEENRNKRESTNSRSRSRGSSSGSWDIRPLIDELCLLEEEIKDSSNLIKDFEIRLSLKRTAQGKGVKPSQVMQLLFQLGDEELLTWSIIKIN